MEGQSIEGGFSHPAFEAQAVFRAVMNAMARPGRIERPQTAASPPGPLSSTAAAIALTLCDHDTPLWLDPRLAESDATRAWLAFQTGAPLAPVPAEAHFALVAEPAKLVRLEEFAQGTADYPDRSTTLILQVESLENGLPLRLEGPGIETTAQLAPTPLPPHFREDWQQNRGRFPRGADVIFAAPDALACLPRTTRITATES